MAAVKVAVRASMVTVETTPVALGNGFQRLGVLAIGWRQVASAAEQRAAEAASAMAEAVAVMVAASALRVEWRGGSSWRPLCRHDRQTIVSPPNTKMLWGGCRLTGLPGPSRSSKYAFVMHCPDRLDLRNYTVENPTGPH